MERDGIKDVKRAANVLAKEGFHQVRDRRYWTSSERKPVSLISLFLPERQGDIRNYDTAEVFRARYYAAERRRKADPAYAEHCDLQLKLARADKSSGEKIYFIR